MRNGKDGKQGQTGAVNTSHNSTKCPPTASACITIGCKARRTTMLSQPFLRPEAIEMPSISMMSSARNTWLRVGLGMLYPSWKKFLPPIIIPPTPATTWPCAIITSPCGSENSGSRMHNRR